MVCQAPNESERYESLNALLVDCNLASDVRLATLATQTAALLASDLVDLVDHAHSNAIERVVDTVYEVVPVIFCLSDNCDLGYGTKISRRII
jgi:SpoVK/Ycf46/Vps4 family AAA+-type ATPase